MPFTIPEAQRALEEASEGRVALAAFDPSLASRVTAVIRALPSLADWTLAGEYLRAGGEGYLTEPPDWRWIAGGGNMAGLVSKARLWNEQRRPSLAARSRPEPRRHLTAAETPNADIAAALAARAGAKP